MSPELVLTTWKAVRGIPSFVWGGDSWGYFPLWRRLALVRPRNQAGTVVLSGATGLWACVTLLLPGGCHRSSCGKSISTLEILVLKRLIAKFVIQVSQVDAKRISFNGIEDYF